MKKLHITTERLTIRHLVPEDLIHFHLYRSNPHVTKYQGFDVMTMEQADAFIKSNGKKRFGKAGEWVQYGIEKKVTRQLIGDCAIKLGRHDTRIAEVEMTISHLEQNNGYAKEALTGILHFLFGQQGVLRVAETVDAENTASVNLLKSLGFRQEGHFIENTFFKGKWSSEFKFALLKREWEAKNK